MDAFSAVCHPCLTQQSIHVKMLTWYTEEEHNNEIKATWLHHACFLVELPIIASPGWGMWVLFDPAFNIASLSDLRIMPCWHISLKKPEAEVVIASVSNLLSNSAVADILVSLIVINTLFKYSCTSYIIVMLHLCHVQWPHLTLSGNNLRTPMGYRRAHLGEVKVMVSGPGSLGSSMRVLFDPAFSTRCLPSQFLCTWGGCSFHLSGWPVQLMSLLVWSLWPVHAMLLNSITC